MPRISFLAARNKTGTPRKGRRRRQRGQAILELALIFPFFLVLVMGIIDFGWALRSYITLTNAAREGARLAVVGCTSSAQEDDVQARVVAYSSGLVTDKEAQVTVTPTCTVDGPKAGAEVAVKADYDYTFITPLGSLIGIMLGGGSFSSAPLHMSTTTRMRTE